MSVLPAANYLSDAGRTEGEMKAAFEQLRNVAAEMPGGVAASQLTIANGAIDPTTGAHSVETEGGAAADTLTTISFTTHTLIGRLIYLWAANASHIVTVQSGGNIELGPGGPFVLSPTFPTVLQRVGTSAVVVQRPFEGLVEGGDVALAIGNTAPAGSTDETASLSFLHAGLPAGRIVSVRRGDYNLVADRDSVLAFLTVRDGVEAERMRLNENGSLLIGQASDSNNTQGLVINQGGNDDEILTLKSSDVSHGVTAITETDSFGVLNKSSPGAGGLNVRGLAGAQNVGLDLLAYSQNDDTGKTTTAGGRFVSSAFKVSGSSATNSVTNSNIFIWRHRLGAANRTAMILDAEGDLHVDGTGSLATFDAFDDAALVRAFDALRSPDQVIRSQWDAFVAYGRDDLVKAGILGRVSKKEARAGHAPLVNITQLQRLHNGAIWQHHAIMNHMAAALDQLLPGFRDLVAARLAAERLPALPAFRAAA